MKRFLIFVLTVSVLIGGAAAGVVSVFGARLGEDGVRAVVMSAGIAFTLQSLTFGISRAIMPVSVWTGWLATVLLRFLVVIAHGVIGAPLLGLPLAPALLSLAVFIFMTSVIEPFFLFDRTPHPPASSPPAPPPTAPPAT
jgi:hypothetical protein